MAEVRAKITAQAGFRCAPEGHTTITIPCGEVVTGRAASWALTARAAKRVKAPGLKPGSSSKRRGDK